MRIGTEMTPQFFGVSSLRQPFVRGPVDFCPQPAHVCFMLPQQRLELLSWVGPLILCPTELRRIPYGVAGVYLLHVRAIAHGGYPVFYVGKSDDLRRRLEEHS